MPGTSRIATPRVVCPLVQPVSDDSSAHAMTQSLLNVAQPARPGNTTTNATGSVSASDRSTIRLNPAIRRPVPRILHFIWLGQEKLPGAHYNNLLHAAELNSNAEVRIYVDDPMRNLGHNLLGEKIGIDAHSELRQRKNVCVTHARMHASGGRDCWADKHAYDLYERCLTSGQFEMATHLLRYHVLDVSGGVCFDVRDDLLTQIDFDRLIASPDEVLHGNVHDDDEIHRQYIDNNPIATRPGNRLIKKVLSQIGENFTDHMRRENAGQATALAFDKTISRADFHEFCGAGLFSRILTRHDARSDAVRHSTPLLNSDPDMIAHTPFHMSLLRARQSVLCVYESGAAPYNERSLTEAFDHLSVDEPRGLPLHADRTTIRRDANGNEYQRVGGRTFRIDATRSQSRPVVLTPDGHPTDLVVASRRRLEKQA